MNLSTCPNKKISFAVVSIGAMLCLATGCTETTQLPRLLQKVTAGGGWGSACPPRDDKEKAMIESSGKLAISPEFNQRLIDEFPPGSNDNRLIEALTAQGFKQGSHCETDPTIQRASFFQKGKGLLPFDVSAQVFWKRDEQGHIVWTKGFVFYSGL